jgi:hypothetical protein
LEETMSPLIEARLRAQPTGDLSEGAKAHIREVGQKGGILAADALLRIFRKTSMPSDDAAMRAFRGMLTRWH